MKNGIYVLKFKDTVNNIYSYDEDVDRISLSSGSKCMPDEISDYTNFDTNSDLFYYDAVNQKSKVDRMDDPKQLMVIIPVLAGASV
jgi:hypothetical protein